MAMPEKSVELPLPWYWTDENLAEQLRREIGENHILYGRKIATLARRHDNDDVLFVVDDTEFAIVHLTWQDKPHSNSRWPVTAVYPSWAAVYRERLLTDSEEFEE